MQVMLIFKLASCTQEDSQVWIMVKALTTVSTTVAEHAKMNRIHLNAEAPGCLYGIFPATTILDKEHVIPDFSSNGRCFLWGNTCSFGLLLQIVYIRHRCTTLFHNVEFHELNVRK